MKAEINSAGALYLERNGDLFHVACPYQQSQGGKMTGCGYWCSKFQVGQLGRNLEQTINVCGTEIQVDLIDNFNKENEDDD